MKTVVIMRGISGSGKSTGASRLIEARNVKSTLISSDAIRAEISDITDQTKNTEVFKIFNDRFIAAMREGVEFIVLDSTNTNGISTELYITDAILKGYHVEVLTRNIDVETAYARVCSRAEQGGLMVPKFVLERQWKAHREGTEWLIHNKRNMPAYDHIIID